MYSKAEITNLLTNQGLVDLIPTLKPCFNLTRTKKIITLGANKFGGQPHLPKTTNWPKINNRVATFVCQLNLESFAVDKLNLNLPTSGLLSFFVHSLFATENNSGEDFDYHKPNCQIIYSPNLDNLEVKNYSKIFFSKLNYQVKESKIIGQKVIEIGKNPSLKPPVEPAANASLAEKEKYKLDYDIYLASKYPFLAKPEAKQTMYKYETVTKNMSKNLYEFPFALDFVSSNPFVSSFGSEPGKENDEGGFALDLEFGQSLQMSKLNWNSFNSDQKQLLEEVLDYDNSLGMFGGNGFGMQGVWEDYIYQELVKVNSNHNKNSSFLVEYKNLEAVHLLSFF